MTKTRLLGKIPNKRGFILGGGCLWFSKQVMEEWLWHYFNFSC